MLGAIYFFWPALMEVEGFWFTMIAVWVVFFISFALFGDIADEILERGLDEQIIEEDDLD